MVKKTYQRGRFSPSSPALEYGLTPEDPTDTLRLSRPGRKGLVRQDPNADLGVIHRRLVTLGPQAVVVGPGPHLLWYHHKECADKYRE